MRRYLSAIMAGLVLTLAGAYLYARVGPGPYPGQRLNRSGSGYMCDADCDTGWDCTEDTCSWKTNSTAEVVTGANEWVFKDGVAVKWGTGEDALCKYDTAVTPDAMVCHPGADARVWYFCEASDVGTDWAKAQQTNPTVCVHAAHEEWTDAELDEE